MRVVLTVHDLGLGGSQTYVLTVAEQLQRLGHEAVLHAAEPGLAGDLARSRGIPVADSEDDLPAEVDALVVQDGIMAHRMADRYPGAPQLFRCPNELFDLQTPPQLPGMTGAVVVLSDRFARRVEALAVETEVIRMRQPVDTERFAARDAIRPQPRRALLFGGYLHGERLEMLVDAWESAGVECVQVANSTSPEAAIADADIVVAKGKAALEGMSCSRAVYVYDTFGTDGWVTPGTYPALEADNFAGQAFEVATSPERLRDDLALYRPAMGLQNRELATRHHRARAHAEELVGILRRLAPRTPTPEVPHRELARLTSIQWQTQSRAFRQAVENAALHRRLIEVHKAWEATEQRALEAERKYRELTGTRRFRAAATAGRIADRVRGRDHR